MSKAGGKDVAVVLASTWRRSPDRRRPAPHPRMESSSLDAFPVCLRLRPSLPNSELVWVSFILSVCRPSHRDRVWLLQKRISKYLGSPFAFAGRTVDRPESDRATLRQNNTYTLASKHVTG